LREIGKQENAAESLGIHMRLENKIAIITGATTGIGRATSVLFCAEGARVVVVGRREDEGRETIRLAEKAGGKAIFIKTDVSHAAQVEEMVTKTISTFGKIDILFNNAGINPEPARKNLTECPEETWDQVMEVNLKGVYLTSKYVIPHMIRNKGGSIINMGSCYGHVGVRNRCVYSASKGGVITLTKSMAIDYAHYNIRVNCISPAIIETDIAKNILDEARRNPQIWKEIITNKIPMDKPGKPEEVAYTALFLASDESSFITGTSLKVDGGYTAQ